LLIILVLIAKIIVLVGFVNRDIQLPVSATTTFESANMVVRMFFFSILRTVASDFATLIILYQKTSMALCRRCVQWGRLCSTLVEVERHAAQHRATRNPKWVAAHHESSSTSPSSTPEPPDHRWPNRRLPPPTVDTLPRCLAAPPSHLRRFATPIWPSL
jgi:hypothetical protein